MNERQSIYIDDAAVVIETLAYMRENSDSEGEQMAINARAAIDRMDAEIERLRAALVSVHDMARLGRKDAIAALELIELNSHKALTGE